MTRIKVGVTAHRRHKHILKLAKGYRGVQKSERNRNESFDVCPSRPSR